MGQTRHRSMARKRGTSFTNHTPRTTQKSTSRCERSRQQSFGERGTDPCWNRHKLQKNEQNNPNSREGHASHSTTRNGLRRTQLQIERVQTLLPTQPWKLRRLHDRRNGGKQRFRNGRRKIRSNPRLRSEAGGSVSERRNYQNGFQRHKIIHRLRFSQTVCWFGRNPWSNH